MSPRRLMMTPEPSAVSSRTVILWALSLTSTFTGVTVSAVTVLCCHSLMVLSSLPETKVLPSGLNATELTPSECPVRVAISRRVATSHSLIV